MNKLKRFSSLALCVLMVLSMLAVCQFSFAYAGTDGDFSFDVVDETATITGYTGTEGEIAIPATVSGYTVTAIAAKAFYHNDVVTAIKSMPSTITGIGNMAFANCSALTEISFPNNLTKIGDGAFIDCAALTNVVVPDKVTYIGMGAFSGCSALESLKVPFIGVQASQSASLADIFDGKGAPGFPATLKTVTVSKDNSIDDGAFEGMKDVQTIIWSTNPTYLGTRAFKDCKSLEKLTVAYTGVAAISDEAFYGCEAINNITLPAKTTKIGEKAFYGCKSLTEFTANKALKIVGKQALDNTGWYENAAEGNVMIAGVFYGYKGAVADGEVVVAEGTVATADMALAGRKDVTKLTLPSSVTYIGTNLLKGTNTVTELNLPFIGQTATEEDTLFAGYLFGGEDETTNATLLPAGLKTVNLSAALHIPSGAFKGCKYITTVTIPEVTTAVRADAFASCAALTTINYNAAAATVSAEAFNGTTNIKSVKFGDTVATIPTYLCTGNAALTEITIPASVTAIDTRAFAGCYNLKTLNFNAVACTAVAPDAFDYCHKLSNIKLASDITRIPANLYSRYGGSTMKEITIPESVTEIDANAFANCSSLETLYYNPADCTIGNAAFAACGNLKEIRLGANVSTIPTNLYTENTSVQTVELPEQITAIAAFAFEGCTALENIKIGSGITKVGNGILNNSKWYDLQDNGDLYLDYIYVGHKGGIVENSTIRIQNGTTAVADGAFAGIGVPFKVFFPNTVSSFEEGTFTNSANVEISCYDSNNAIIDLAAAYGITCNTVSCPDTDYYYVINGTKAEAYCFDCGQLMATMDYTDGMLDDEFVQTTAPTCTTDGVATVKSTAATKAIAKTGHGAIVWKQTKAPTCTAKGQKIGYCKDCGAALKTEELDMIAHVPGVWKIEKNATTYAHGLQAKRCTVCGTVTDTKAINKLEEANVIEGFVDVSESDWYYQTVNFAVENGFFNGVKENEFAPTTTMTRAMFVTVLYRLAGSPSVAGMTNKFTDVKKSAWYADAVKWASTKGIVNGMTATTFKPDDSITREQICTIIVRYSTVAGITLTAKNEPEMFRDTDKISSYALKAVMTCQKAGIVNGKSNRYFDPLGKATRAEVAQVLRNFAEGFLAD